MPTTHVEVDLLSFMEVPAGAYYGIHTQRIINDYQISGKTISDVPEFIRGMIMVKKVITITNQHIHALPSGVAETIVAACNEILEKGRYMDQFLIDVFQGRAGTSVSMNINEVIVNLALELLGQEKGRYGTIYPNDDVDQCQPTNDAYPTGFCLVVHMSPLSLQRHFDSLVEALYAKGDEFNGIITMGHTQLQGTVPMTLGQVFHVFTNSLKEEQEFTVAASARLLQVNLSATAIGTGVNAPAGYREAVTQAFQEVSGFDMSSAKDLVEATSDTGVYVSVHACLKCVAMKIPKMHNDSRLLASGPRAGLNGISLSGRAVGSLIMPTKVNPVIPEVAGQVCFKVLGNDVTLTWVTEAGQFQLNVMESAIGACLLETIGLLHNAIDTLRDRCITGITANANMCRGYVDNSVDTITYLNPVIGHYEGGMVGEEVARTGRSVHDTVLERGLMDESKLDCVLSAENLMHPEYRGKRYVAGKSRLDNLSWTAFGVTL